MCIKPPLLASQQKQRIHLAFEQYRVLVGTLDDARSAPRGAHYHADSMRPEGHFKIALGNITVKLLLFRPPDSKVIRLHGHDVSYVGLKHNQVG